MVAAPTISKRQSQLSMLAGLCILFTLVSFLLGNYATERITKAGTTVVLKPADSPIRFIGFALTGLFLGACLVSPRKIRRRELLLLVSLGLTQLFANRLEDATVSYTWQFAAITVGLLWHRIPIHPKLVSATCWLFVAINGAATLQKPGWAFFRAAEDGHVVFGRLAACTTHPNEMGIYAGLLALVVAVNVRTPMWRLLWVGLILLLLLSGSKTSVACYLLVYACYQRNWRIPSWLAIGLPLGSVVYAMVAATGAIGGYLSLTGRTNLWTVLLEAVARQPVEGLGPQGVELASQFAKVGFEVQNHAHDAALQVLVQGGMLAFGSYCAFMLCMRKTANSSYLGSALFLFLAVHSVTESTLPWTWPWLLCYTGAFTLKTMQADLPLARPKFRLIRSRRLAAAS